jgi:hypothetical protein
LPLFCPAVHLQLLDRPHAFSASFK